MRKTYRTKYKYDASCSLNFIVHSGDDNIRTNEKATFENLFDPVQEGGNRVETVLVMDIAGSDVVKNVCHRILFEWANGIVTIQQLQAKPILPIYFDLRSLEREQNLEVVLFDHVHSFHQCPNKTPECTEKVLKHTGQDVILLLDGYNEEIEHVQQKVSQFLDDKMRCVDSPFVDASVLITRNSNRRVEKDFLEHFENRFVICEGDEQPSCSEGVEDFNAIIPNSMIVDIGMSNFSISELCLNWLQTGSHKRGDMMYQAMFLLLKKMDESFEDDNIRELLDRLGRLYFFKKGLYVTKQRLQKYFRDNFQVLIEADILRAFNVKANQEEVFKPHDVIIGCLVEKYLEGLQSTLSGSANIEEFFSQYLCAYDVVFTKTAIVYRDDDEAEKSLRVSVRICGHNKLRKIAFKISTDNLQILSKNHSSDLHDSACKIELSKMKLENYLLRKAFMGKILSGIDNQVWQRFGNILSYSEKTKLFKYSKIGLYLKNALDSEIFDIMPALASTLNENVVSRNGATVFFQATDEVEIIFPCFMKYLWENSTNATSASRYFSELLLYMDSRPDARLQQYEATLGERVLDFQDNTLLDWENVKAMKIKWMYCTEHYVKQ